ncbi:MAG: hypothetical protein U0270_42210 [Labilithrix sp.]
MAPALLQGQPMLCLKGIRLVVGTVVISSAAIACAPPETTGGSTRMKARVTSAVSSAQSQDQLGITRWHSTVLSGANGAKAGTIDGQDANGKVRFLTTIREDRSAVHIESILPKRGEWIWDAKTRTVTRNTIPAKSLSFASAFTADWRTATGSSTTSFRSLRAAKKGGGSAGGRVGPDDEVADSMNYWAIHFGHKYGYISDSKYDAYNNPDTYDAKNYDTKGKRIAKNESNKDEGGEKSTESGDPKSTKASAGSGAGNKESDAKDGDRGAREGGDESGASSGPAKAGVDDSASKSGADEAPPAGKGADEAPANESADEAPANEGDSEPAGGDDDAQATDDLPAADEGGDLDDVGNDASDEQGDDDDGSADEDSSADDGSVDEDSSGDDEDGSADEDSSADEDISGDDDGSADEDSSGDDDSGGDTGEAFAAKSFDGRRAAAPAPKNTCHTAATSKRTGIRACLQY